MYDFIVVGAGSAGSLVAGRLAENGANVLVLEAGGRDTSILIHMPAGFQKLLVHGQFLFPYETVPQSQLDGRARSLPVGKGLGGSSSLNAMCWVVGHPNRCERGRFVLCAITAHHITHLVNGEPLGRT